MTNPELLDLLNKDLPEGLDWVVGECKDKCIGFALKNLVKTGNLHERKTRAKEMFSDALLTFTDHVQQGRITELKANVGTYLCATMKYAYLGEQRRAKRAPLTLTEDYAVATVEEREERELVRRALRRLIRELGDACRELLTFRYYDNLPYAEILTITAEQYASVNVLRNKSSKCMKRLREKVSENVPAIRTSPNA
ncbi:RNA polymerase sigma factor [Neolewinella agarilytica]|uniref:RNA polymerase sigma factor, sigma-70 family n=1 Tax=Neolewinella agarilytica TaxID=478744 RepID=A0A1H9H9Y9_9BACT|nr:sigma-70 family RNA polymerase sigma factor [Neolewinella agarilytica]SEQ59161.1 hypothetical protein SAMN05444359_11276 [Neolewinella agarilytica]